MSGTYKGTYGGGNDFGPKEQSLGYIFAVNDALQAQAAINGAAAMGVSQAELIRAVYGGGPAVGVSSPAASGPGRASSGTAAGGAAGSPGVLTAGSGSVGSGPGTRHVAAGGFVGAGSGLGGVLSLGPKVLPMKSADKVSVQPMTISGFDIKTDQGWSDGGDFEQRYGDSELLSTLYGIAVITADGVNTVMGRGTPIGDGIDALGGVVDGFVQKQLLQPPTDFVDKYSPAAGGGFYSE